MTQDDKQLLFKDLCARLPYGVNLHIEFYDLQGDGELASRDVKLTTGNICYCFDNSHWVNFKPYLRPMSSMTEEETDRMWEIYESGPAEESSVAVAEYLYERNLDCHYLIEKDLALEAPEDIYKTE